MTAESCGVIGFTFIGKSIHFTKDFCVNPILICYLLPNTYINSLLEGVLCRKWVEVETLYGILWHCPALVGYISVFCTFRYKGTLVWALHRKVIAIPADSVANRIPVLLHGANRKLSVPPAVPETCVFHSIVVFVFLFFQTPDSKTNLKSSSLAYKKRRPNPYNPLLHFTSFLIRRR